MCVILRYAVPTGKECVFHCSFLLVVSLLWLSKTVWGNYSADSDLRFPAPVISLGKQFNVSWQMHLWARPHHHNTIVNKTSRSELEIALCCHWEVERHFKCPYRNNHFIFLPYPGWLIIFSHVYVGTPLFSFKSALLLLGVRKTLCVSRFASEFNCFF